MTAGIDYPVWSEFVSRYSSTVQANDALWKQMTDLTDATPILKRHRDWVEDNKWGFGDRAFHAMWFLMLADLASRQAKPLRLLEIGVYKGQVLSLWTMIARHLNVSAEVTGISPLAGKPPVMSILHRLRMVVDRGYREDAMVGNLHEQSNFASDVRKIFGEFGLDPSSMRLVEGLSQDPAVHSQVKDMTFDVVYVDGGHRYEEVSADLRLYAPHVRTGGYLVVDDAGYFLPGTLFFKGFEPVSRAAEQLDRKAWKNILNVGHNRVFERIQAV